MFQTFFGGDYFKYLLGTIIFSSNCWPETNQFWPLWAASQRGQTPRDWFSSANYYALLQPVIEMHRRDDSSKKPQGGDRKSVAKMEVAEL